jgi:hypothetical protein
VAVAPTVVNFAAGETSKTAAVTVNGDTVLEPDETFLLRLSSPVGALLSDDTGVATITNDDAYSYLSINDITVPEGNSGTKTGKFTVTRSGSTAQPASVMYTTNNASAVAPTDYVTVPPTELDFAAGETSKTVSVTVNGDTTFESNETFVMRLSSAVNTILSDDTGVATITNDDTRVYLSINDTYVTEGNAGTTTATFTVTRSGGSSAAVSVSYVTGNGSAVAGTDYVAVPATVLNFASGETSKKVTVAVNGDTTVEPDETFVVRLVSPVIAIVSDDTGTATIENDD